MKKEVKENTQWEGEVEPLETRGVPSDETGEFGKKGSQQVDAKIGKGEVKDGKAE